MVAARKRDAIDWTEKESLFVEMKRVPRPVMSRHKYDTEKEIAAILKTVDEGDAVQLKLRSADDFKKAHMALRHGVRKFGAAFKYQRYGADELRVWAEKIAKVKR